MNDLRRAARAVDSKRIIVALDYTDPAQALMIARQLDAGVCRLKVGKELFTSGGPALVEQLVNQGFDIFLDLKFHDIPNTVGAACRVASALGVWMINVHAQGGRRMLEAARESVMASRQPPLLTAVTVLTSMTNEDLHETGCPGSVTDRVDRLAGLAHEVGLDGVVCSAHEARRLRSNLGAGFVLVTPGIRPAGVPSNDQRRVMTPTEAVKAGADYLVIGRPITAASDPLSVLRAIQAELGKTTSD